MIKASSNADKVIKGLKDYRKDLKSKIRELMLRLHKLGVNIANAKLTVAEYAGTNDATVLEPHWIDDSKLALEVRGNSIMFIEFGTGITFYGGDNSHPLAGTIPFSERGTFGKGQGMKPHWIYEGEVGTSKASWELHDKKGNPTGAVMTKGNPANRVLYETGKELRENILRVAREVFGNG